MGSYPHAPMREYRYEVDGVSLSRVPGTEKFVMSKFEVRTTRTYETGERFVQRNTVTLSNVRFECTDADLQPIMPIRDETPVSIQDAPSIEAEWRGGEVVKVVNQEALKRFAGVGDSGKTPPFWRHWLLLLNVAAVVGLLLYFSLRHRRFRRPTN